MKLLNQIKEKRLMKSILTEMEQSLSKNLQTQTGRWTSKCNSKCNFLYDSRFMGQKFWLDSIVWWFIFTGWINIKSGFNTKTQVLKNRTAKSIMFRLFELKVELGQTGSNKVIMYNIVYYMV